MALKGFVRGQLQLFLPSGVGVSARWGRYEIPVTRIVLPEPARRNPHGGSRLQLVASQPIPDPVEPPRTWQWMTFARCADTPQLADTFFPDAGARTDLNSPAKEMCARCPVRIACLEHALATKQRFGIWGGKTRHERRRIAAARLTVRRGGTVQKQDAQDWLRGADAFAVDQLAAVLEKAAADGIVPDWQRLAAEALSAAAEMLDEADTG